MTGGLMKTTTSRLALAAVASMVATGAMAADLGGNCCADLEERVSELEATTARKGNRKVSLTVSGEVVKDLVWHDSGAANAWRANQLSVRDGLSGHTATKFRFLGSAKVSAEWTFGYNLEIAVAENFARDTNQSGISSSGAAHFEIRQSHFYATSSRLGQVAVGQLSTATDGIYDISLANINVTRGGADQATLMAGNTATIFQLDSTLDGGRRQGARYTSPVFAGFSLSSGWYHSDQDFSTGTNKFDTSEEWDIALRYAGEFNGIRMAAGVGYREVNPNAPGVADDTIKVWAGSGSIMHVPTGLFISGGVGSVEDEKTKANDRVGYHGEFGIQRNWFGIGDTTLYGEYIVADFDTERAVASGISTTGGNDGTMWGLGLNQMFDAAATQLYIGYRHYEADNLLGNNTKAEDVSVVTSGVKIRF